MMSSYTPIFDSYFLNGPSYKTNFTCDWTLVVWHAQKGSEESRSE